MADFQQLLGASRQTFIRRLIRAVDLTLVVSDRAKQAQQAANVLGFPSMELLYDGGLEVRSHDLIPRFLRGLPPVSDPAEIVVGMLEDDGYFATVNAVYLPGVDHFEMPWGTKKRCESDLWLLVPDYEQAFHLAIERSRARASVATY